MHMTLIFGSSTCGQIYYLGVCPYITCYRLLVEAEERKRRGGKRWWNGKVRETEGETERKRENPNPLQGRAQDTLQLLCTHCRLGRYTSTGPPSATLCNAGLDCIHTPTYLHTRLLDLCLNCMPAALTAQPPHSTALTATVKTANTHLTYM